MYAVCVYDCALTKGCGARIVPAVVLNKQHVIAAARLRENFWAWNIVFRGKRQSRGFGL